MVSCTRVLLSAALAGSYNNNKYHLDTGLVLQCSGDTEQCGECHQVSPLCRHTCAETEQPRTQGQWEPRLPPLHDVVSNTASIQTSAVKRSIGSTTGCTITEKAPTVSQQVG